jgi:WD40 repeat protein/serine/threonine protein kinase
MIVLMQCVAEAVASKGLRGLLEIVPGGGFLYDVASDAIRRMKERKRADELKDEVLKAAAASLDEAKAAAEKVAKEVAGNAPTEDRIALEMYLTQIPGALRQSLRRADDPSGKSVPANFAITEPADLLKRLPARVPHFRPGVPLPGKPGWQLGELLGTGGFGEVWLARNPALSALKGAVKFGLDPQARDRLLRHEGTLVNRVMEQGKHPNVVQLLDAHLEGDAPWLMYEYIPGGDLTGLILSWQSLPAGERVSRTVAALRTLASAVGHFHRLNPPIVHRDLKPANVLLRVESRNVESRKVGSHPSGQADVTTLRPDDLGLMVTDFGIGGVAAAASLAQEASRRSTGAFMSQLWGSYTPLYASPQQQAGSPPDPRDDVHALGVIGFQMLTGKLDATLGADYAKTLRRLTVPEPLIELLGDCAAHDPDNRPKDAAELAEKLTSVQLVGRAVPDAAGTSGTARPTQPPAATPGMEHVACPQCQATLRVATGETRPVKCGQCGHTFRPFAPPPAPPPVSPEAVAALRQVLAFSVPITPKDPPAERPRPTAKPVDRSREREREREPEPEPERERPPRRVVQPRPGGGRLLKFGCLLGVLLAVGMVGGLGYLFYQLFPRGGSGGTGQLPQPGPGTTPTEARPGKLGSFVGVSGRVAEATFTNDGRRLVTVSEDGFVQLWDVDDPTTAGQAPLAEIATTVKGHRPAVAPDRPLLAAADEQQIQTWDTATGQKKGRFGGLGEWAARLAFSPDGRWLVAVGKDSGVVTYWDTTDRDRADQGQTLVTLSGEAGLAFDPTGRYLATSAPSEVKLWEVRAQGPWITNRTLTAAGSPKPTALGFSADGKRFIAGGADGKPRVWDVEKSGDPQVYDTKQGASERVVVTPKKEARLLVFTIDGSGTGCLWDGAKPPGSPQTPIPGNVRAAAFNPAGSMAATAGDDRVVHLWELFFVKPRFKLIGHGAAVRAVAFSPDGRRLASVDTSGTVILWSVPAEISRQGFDLVEIQ